MDTKGDQIASIDSLGIVRDMNNFQMGQFKSNGDIVDGNNDVIGTISSGVFKDMNGDALGSINSSGEVFDANNLKIGEVVNQNLIQDINSNSIGTTSAAVNEEWLAAFYFFFFE
ncbi:MAG: DUF3659 domain-containing protein [Flavobacteriales bacterium]|nr:DUF3659 domain-containing protein [Flavobacteriales bacterium]